MRDENRDLMWGEPFEARRFHIFDGSRMLCGNWLFGAADEPVDLGVDGYRKGDDCKECCRKAGLLEGDDA